MIDVIKKFLKQIGWIVLGIICVAIALFSIMLGLGSAAEIVVKIVTIAGGGSLVLGIVMTPFFIFGVIQILRGLCAVFNADLKKMDSSDISLWHLLYIPATIIGYIAVILAICFWSAAA